MTDRALFVTAFIAQYIITIFGICQQESCIKFVGFDNVFYSLFLWILPLMVFGKLSRNTTMRGYLYGAV